MDLPASVRALAQPRVVLVLIWVVATAINLTKAFHIDDTAYLSIAKWISVHPLHPMSGSVFWGNVVEPIHRTNQPHLFFYLMAAWMRVFGSTEVAQHLLLSLFTLGGVLLFHDLSKALLQRDSTLPVALLFLGPAFLPSQNVMTDVPLLFFWLLFFWGIVNASRSEHGVRWLVVASVAASSAVLTKYSGLVLIPTLLFFTWRLRFLKAWYVVLLPLLTIAAWSGFNEWDYGHIHLLDRPLPANTLTSAVHRLPEWLIALGGVAPLFALSGRKAFPGPRSVPVAAGVVSVLFGLRIAILYAAIPENEGAPIHWTNTLLALFCAANGAWLLLSTGAAILREWMSGVSSDRAECLAVWVAGAAVFVCLFAPFMAVRHVLLSLPPMILAVCLNQDHAIRRPRVAFVLVLSTALGLVLSVSDWQYADVYRRQAREIREQLGASRRIWFTGHWGWQWYAEASNMIPYERGRSRLASGDILVEPALVGTERVTASDDVRLRRLERVEVASSLWTRVRTMSRSPFGGFYLNTGQHLPWKVSNQPLDVFTLSVVEGAP